jgi:hypothetical protein
VEALRDSAVNDEMRTSCRNGKAREQLLDGMAHVKSQVRQTGKMQRLTAILADGKLGVSFLALDSSDDPGNLARQLECYAIVQKYAERCPTWVALAADISSARLVDICMFLTGPWQEDPTLDRLAGQFISTRSRKGS